MRIGIIIHSVTGNTLSVGEKIHEELSAKGFDAVLERVIAADEKNPGLYPVLLSKPDITPYDVIVFGAPVHGFTLSKAMQAYISQLSGLENKKVRLLCHTTVCKTVAGRKQSNQENNETVRGVRRLCKEDGDYKLVFREARCTDRKSLCSYEQ